jgi:hypothetical protein
MPRYDVADDIVASLTIVRHCRRGRRWRSSNDDASTSTGGAAATNRRRIVIIIVGVVVVGLDDDARIVPRSSRRPSEAGLVMRTQYERYPRLVDVVVVVAVAMVVASVDVVGLGVEHG